MDEPLSLIIHACKLAKDLESNLPNLSNQPNVLSNSCDEIVGTFKKAIHLLNSNNPSSSYQPVEPRPPDHEGNVQEWLKSNYMRTIDQLQSQFSNVDNMETLMELGSETSLTTMSSCAKILESGAGKDTVGSSPSGPERSDSGKSPMAQRPRRRKDCVNTRIVTVPIPRTGNTEIPPEDGFTWRKYGQKEILGSKFPRSYYRCTHKNFFGCDAKKYVQRVNEDPNMFEITYFNNHACLKSFTALSAYHPADPKQERFGTILPPPPPPPPPLPTSWSPSRWLHMGTEPMKGEDTNTTMDLQLQMYPTFESGCNESSMAIDRGRSEEEDTREADFPVAEFADVMFNSGNNSSGMDSIFPSKQEK